MASALSVSNEREIQPWNLSVEQLHSLKGQHEDEIRSLTGQLEQLYGAKNRFVSSKSTLSDMGTAEKGRQILVPLNSSLYVPGKVSDPNKVSLRFFYQMNCSVV
jgi:prefoldin alpha subunit